MVHERDEKYDGQDDSEYHFSDDQLSYEPEADLKSTSARSGKPDIMTKIVYYKRPLIGIGVFLILIFLVYKIIAPSATTTPTTEFAQNNVPTTTQVTETKTTKTTTIEPATTMKVVTPTEPQPAPATTAPNLAPTADQTVQVQQPAPVLQQQTLAPPVGQPGVAIQQPTQQTVVTEVPPSGAQGTVTTTTVTQQQTGAAPVVVPGTAAMSLPDRLTVLETQNAKLQSDFTQKIAEQEAQNAALQGKLQDLNMRMASIETTLIRLGRMMHEMKGGKSLEDSIGGGAEPVRMIAKPALGPRVTYSVQAIIPGRAWLKSESGETVTVAEGDVVKDLGRITKIDPYDGVVQIDSSGRLISLSYGTSSE